MSGAPVEWPNYLNPATGLEEPVPPPQWDSMQVDVQDILLRTQMDSGPPKIRRRYTGASRYLTCSFVFTFEQAAAFNNWYQGDLGFGSNRFNWITPYSNAPCVASLRKPPTVTPASSIIRRTDGGYHMLWKYTCDIEIHP
jgi:hypothetical protein